jgi:uncharacterized protein YbjT (DUF2867 family)/pyridoxine/pyridoxamine 5'-phosphate oxidase
MQQANRRLQLVVDHVAPNFSLEANPTSANLPRVLVLGATGATGEEVAYGLLKKGGVRVAVAVRALSKGEAFKKAGAELVIFDYDKPETFANAFKGVDRLYCMTPPLENPPATLAPAIAAAKAAGVKFIVRLSSLLVAEDPNFNIPLTRKHKGCEDLVINSGIPYCILRPGFFMSLLQRAANGIKTMGALAGAGGSDTKIAWIDPKDIADMAVEALLHPEKHTNQIYSMTGSEAFTNQEMAELFASVLGRPIKYLNLPPEMFGRLVKENLKCPDWQVDVILQLESAKAAGLAGVKVPQHIQRVLGRPPGNVRDWLVAHKAFFGSELQAKGYKLPPPIPWDAVPLAPMFDENSKMANDPTEELKKLMKAVKGAPNHSIFLATVDKNGRPGNRIVSLKEINEKGISFMTDSISRKMQDVAHNNRVAGVMFWREHAIQVRFEGKLVQATEQENKDAWDMVPSVTRWNITVGNVSRKEGPGTHWETREQGIDIYRRLLPTYPEFVTDVAPNEHTYYIVPDYWEFWQMNPPFADRVAYEKSADGWKKVRRSPP